MPAEPEVQEEPATSQPAVQEQEAIPEAEAEAAAEEPPTAAPGANDDSIKQEEVHVEAEPATSIP